MNTTANGLRVLVTAGAAGIGRAIARSFIEHGARVHICDIDTRALADAKQSLPTVTQSVADVAKPADVDRLFVDAERALGGLDVLVNNAGIAGPTARVEDIALEDWERCIAIDLNGMFYCTRKAMPLIKGRLGFAMRTPYAAAKWAVVGFTKSLAVEAGADKVRVNCIQPGYVEGERIERVIRDKAKGLGITEDEMRRRIFDSVSLREFVSAQDIANMALFLATDAGKHITGQALSVCADVRYTI